MRSDEKILLLSVSPRKQGTSAMLLKRMQAVTGGEMAFLPWKGNLDPLLQAMRQSETIVISGPCWINTYPARLFELLEAAAASGGFGGQKLYGIINGGMPYIHTHIHGLKALSLFAKSCALEYRGGFVLGGGAMLDGQPLERHLNRKTVVRAFDRFIEHVKEGSISPDSLFEEAQHPPGRLMTRVFAKILTIMTNWRIRKHGHNPHAPYDYSASGSVDNGKR